MTIDQFLNSNVGEQDIVENLIKATTLKEVQRLQAEIKALRKLRAELKIIYDDQKGN